MTEYVAPLSLGPLAAALAKAQTQFPAITRDKRVTVKTKDGGSYSFAYAPLDQILGAVRGPLAANGLVVVQTLDGMAVVTTLIHESGASISGRVDLPSVENVQGLGSAITYLRRYAIQAVLGIAAEEDDDGNRAVGNQVRADVAHGDDGSLIGTLEVGDKVSSDFMLHTDAERGPVIGFRLRGAKGGILVRCFGPLAVQLDAHRKAAVGATVTCWGHVTTEKVPAKGNKAAFTYQVLDAERVRVPEVGDLPIDTTPESSEPSGAVSGGLDAGEQAELDGLNF